MGLRPTAAHDGTGSCVPTVNQCRSLALGVGTGCHVGYLSSPSSAGFWVLQSKEHAGEEMD